MLGSHRSARAGAMLATLALALAVSPAAVSADGAISHSGKYGVHYLVDTNEFPGGTCTYNASSNLVSIRMRWPHVEGYDTGPGANTQRVSWRFQVYRDSGGGPMLYATTPLTYAYTDDRTAAFWPSRTYNFASVAPNGDYSIHVQMYWYRPDNTVRGSATHHPDVFKHLWDNGPSYANSCNWAH